MFPGLLEPEELASGVFLGLALFGEDHDVEGVPRGGKIGGDPEKGKQLALGKNIWMLESQSLYLTPACFFIYRKKKKKR